MGVSKEKSLCRKASEYYYDLLDGSGAAVPEGVRDHVERCPFCQEQIRQLGQILSETEQAAGLPASRAEVEMVETLSLHFERIDEPVTCSHVKPFLPGLVAPSPPLRIPTPITVHVEHCPLCAQDLAALRALHLGGEQLKRLSRLYGESPGRDATECWRARPAVAALGSLSTEGIDPDLLNHVSTCPPCRAAAYQQRERLLAADSWGTAGRGAILSCNDISPADFFDLVVPYGVTGAGDKTGRAETVVAHIRACRRCLERVQALHHTIYDIAERADSEISTVYHTADAAGSMGDEIGQGRRYPVDVQVLHSEPEPVLGRGDSHAASETAWRRAPGASSRKPLTKVALAAAAAVVLAILLPMHTPTASGTNVGEVLRCLENAPNVHVTTFFRHDTRPTDEMWIARHLRMLVLKTGDRYVLYDLKRRQKRELDPNAGLSAPIKLDDYEYGGSSLIMAACVGGPLATIAQDTRVRQMPDDTPDGLDRQVVYELASEKQTSGGIILFYRWRFVLDPATGLPHRIEFFVRESPEGEWELRTTKTFEYLTEPDMKDEIKAMVPAR